MTISCQKCGKELNVSERSLKTGARFRCLKCGNLTTYEQLGEQSGIISNSSQSIHKEVYVHDKSVSDSRISTGPQEIDRINDKYTRYGYLIPQTDKIEERSFMEHLPEAFSFPLKKGGILMLVIGSVFFTVILFFSKYAPLIGIIGFVLVSGYISAFMMKIVSRTADGEIDIPDWPEFSDWWDDIILPWAQMIITALASFCPLIAYIVVSYVLGGRPSVLVIGALVLAGAFYYPMALLAMCLFRGMHALNPVLLFQAIGQIFSDYIIACILMLIIFVLKWGLTFFSNMIPFVGPFIDNFLMLYLVMLEMRILGLIYYANKNKLQWF